MTSLQTDDQPDWFSAAASEAMLRFEVSLGSQFKRRQWREFAARLAPEMDILFRLVHRLYGWRFDFAWTLDRLVGEALAGYAARPRWAAKALSGSVPTQTDQSPSPPSAAQPEFWATFNAGMEKHHHSFPEEVPRDSPDDWPSDSLADFVGDLVDWANAIGVTHLHFDGSIPGKAACRDLLKTGLGLVADLNLDHVDRSDVWARAAIAGSKQESDYFVMFPDRSDADAYAAGMQSFGARIDGDAFSWHPEVAEGRWIWTSHDPNSWDLDYRNPELLAAMAGRLFAMANRGVSRICLQGLPRVWKAAGTHSINLPEAHLVVQILACLMRIAAPGTSLVAGSERDRSAHLPPHERFIGTEECSLGYDLRVTALIWEAINSVDARILGNSIVARYPNGCSRVVSVRSQASIPVAKSAGLQAAIEGDDRHWVELAARRTLAVFAMLLVVADIPEIAIGDEIGLGDEGAQYLGELTSAPLSSKAGSAVEARLGPEGLLMSGLARLSEARRASTRFVDLQPIRVLDLDDIRVLALVKGGLLLLVNLSGESLAVSRVGLPPELDFDIVSNGPWVDTTLTPYGFRYLVATSNGS